MQQAKDPEDDHSTGEEPRRTPGLRDEPRPLHGNAEPEEDRENRDELELEDGRDHEDGGRVKVARLGIQTGRHLQGKGEVPSVHHHDPKKREASKNVNRLDPAMRFIQRRGDWRGQWCVHSQRGSEASIGFVML